MSQSRFYRYPSLHGALTSSAAINNHYLDSLVNDSPVDNYYKEVFTFVYILWLDCKSIDPKNVNWCKSTESKGNCITMVFTHLIGPLRSFWMPASVAQLDAPSDWRPGGRGFNPRRGRQHSFVSDLGLHYLPMSQSIFYRYPSLHGALTSSAAINNHYLDSLVNDSPVDNYYKEVFTFVYILWLDCKSIDPKNVNWCKSTESKGNCITMVFTHLIRPLRSFWMPASVAQLDAPSDWRPGGRGFNPRRGRQHSFVESDHEIFSTVILSLPLIQEGQLSVSGERMCTILVNRLED